MCIRDRASINPGNNYNFDPFVSVYSPSIAKFDRRDVVLNLSNMNNDAGIYRNFTIGETVNQTLTVTSQVLTVNSVSSPTGGFVISSSDGLNTTNANNKIINDLSGTTIIQTQQTGSGGNGNTTITTLGTMV